jgi:nucleoside 2-deoxyribosyltransferase
MRVYLAGPLFTWGEREQNKAVASELRSLGHEVFVPQENEQREMTARGIFDADVAGMDWANVCVACMDGPDPDSGTCFELGYMHAKHKPSVLYRSDFRHACGEGLGCMANLMMSVPAEAEHHLGFADPATIARKIHEELTKLERRFSESR